jgi:hypothetical protein
VREKRTYGGNKSGMGAVEMEEVRENDEVITCTQRR